MISIFLTALSGQFASASQAQVVHSLVKMEPEMNIEYKKIDLVNLERQQRSLADNDSHIYTHDGYHSCQEWHVTSNTHAPSKCPPSTLTQPLHLLLLTLPNACQSGSDVLLPHQYRTPNFNQMNVSDISRLHPELQFKQQLECSTGIAVRTLSWAQPNTMTIEQNRRDPRRIVCQPR